MLLLTMNHYRLCEKFATIIVIGEQCRGTTIYQQERTPNRIKWKRGFHLINTFQHVILYKTLKKATLSELLKD